MSPLATAAARASSSQGGMSAIVIAAIVVGALLLLLALALALALRGGRRPRWALEARHALAEASYRASATFSELGDWVRLGR